MDVPGLSFEPSVGSGPDGGDVAVQASKLRKPTSNATIVAAGVGLLFMGFAADFGRLAILLGIGVAFAYADITRARSIVDRRPDLRRARSRSDLFWWLSWEFGDLPGEGDGAPKDGDDILARIVSAAADGRLQVAGLISAVIVVTARSPVVSAEDRALLLLAGELMAFAVLAPLPARARRRASELRRRASRGTRVAACGSVLLFAVGTGIWSLPLVILGLFTGAVAFEAIHDTNGTAFSWLRPTTFRTRLRSIASTGERKRCAFCAFSTDDARQFERHVVDAHGWGRAVAQQRAPGWTLRLLVADVLAFLLFVGALGVTGGGDGPTTMTEPFVSIGLVIMVLALLASVVLLPLAVLTAVVSTVRSWIARGSHSGPSGP